MGTYVTPQGLQIPTVEQILSEMTEQQRSEIDPLLNTDTDSPIGQMNGIVASHIREPWEVLEIAWNGNNPDACEGTLLEHVAAITGTKRAPATKSKFAGARKLKVNLNAGTTLLVGRKVAVAGNPNVEFETTEEITANAGTGFYYVPAECTQTGPITANAGTVTVIVTAVSGWNSVTNPFDAEKGNDQDNEAQLRERRERELRATGSATVDAMTTDLLAYETEDGAKPIQDCHVFSNDTDATDANGLPPHSMEALVFDGVSQDVPNDTIAQIVWNSKPGGIQMIGNSTGTAKDSRGRNRTIKFSRPTLKDVLFIATLTLTNPNQVPSQYESVIRSAIIAEFAKRVTVGSLIRCNHYEAAALKVDGIEDCVIQIGFAPGPVGAAGVNLQLGTRQMGYVQTVGITVQ